MRARPRIVVVGGGVMGASVAWHLARAEADVLLLERLPVSAGGVTRWSYGWVGTSAGRPSDDPVCFALQRRAIQEFASLDMALGGMPKAALGAIVWEATADATAALIAEQRQAGIGMEALSRPQIAAIEPRLAVPHDLAAFAPDDFAVEPIDFVQRLLAGAESAGATIRFNTLVVAIETRNGRVTGVRTKAGQVPADFVVLANAMGALDLAAPLDVALPLRSEPAVLMRFKAEQGLVRHILYGDRSGSPPWAVAVRPCFGGGLPGRRRKRHGGVGI
ncbi:MAG TPA: FAD-dependent oxidoreductase [Mesorhizobium sp.]|nr:FAD-dependent oxidoreductase [Mesorhizobium sp.]